MPTAAPALREGGRGQLENSTLLHTRRFASLSERETRGHLKGKSEAENKIQGQATGCQKKAALSPKQGLETMAGTKKKKSLVLTQIKTWFLAAPNRAGHEDTVERSRIRPSQHEACGFFSLPVL